MYRECSGRCNNGNRQALNVNNGELKRRERRGEEGKERKWGSWSIVTRIDSLVSFSRFFEDFLASTIFVSHWRASLLEQIDIYGYAPSEGLRKIGLAGADMKGTRARIYEILVQR